MSSNGAIYLVNYGPGRSGFCIYGDVSQSFDGQIPDSTYLIPGPPGVDVFWEGQQVTGRLSSTDNIHVFFTNISADALSQPQGILVGTANEGPVFGVPPPGAPTGAATYKSWNIYRGNDRVLYNDPTYGRCISRYECRTADQLVGGPEPPPVTHI